MQRFVEKVVDKTIEQIEREKNDAYWWWIQLPLGLQDAYITFLYKAWRGHEEK